MGDGFDPYDTPQLGHVMEVCTNAAVIGLEEDLQYKTGKQLRLGEFFRRFGCLAHS